MCRCRYSAHLVVFIVYLGAFVIVTRPFAYQDMVLGVSLLICVIVVLFVAIVVSARNKAAEEELILRLREM